MSQHQAEVVWQRGDGDDFVAGRYSRRHRVRFDGGAQFSGSSSPHVVPLPWSDAAAIDPEEAFVAALASCHMLCFLGLAAAAGWSVERYCDAAVGTLAKNEAGKLAVTLVVLRPFVEWSGDRQPSAAALTKLHHRAHEECFIASSVKTEVRCEPQLSANKPGSA